MKYRFKGFIFICSVIMLFTGCMGIKTDDNALETETEVILNDRQVGILKEEGLPTSYEDLNISQKNAIVAIEDMLQYLDKKYEIRFLYGGSYTPSVGVETDSITAFAEGDNDSSNIITVYRDFESSEYIYDDDYEEILASYDYIKILEEFIKETGIVDDFWVCSDVYKLSDNSNKSLIEHAHSSNSIFVSGITDKELEILIEQYNIWMGTYNLDCAVITNFILQNSEDYKATNKYNYIDEINSGKYEMYATWSISKSGRVSVY